MSSKQIVAICAGVLSVTLLSGFGLGDLTDKMGDVVGGEDCDKAENKDKCKTEAAVKGMAIGVAAEIIRQVVIEFTTTQTASEQDVVKKYTKKNKTLPEKTAVAFYRSKADPGKVIKAGDAVAINTEFEVVPGKKEKDIVIEESISIYDNEDNSKMLKSLTKAVNEDSKKAGSFKNEFKFTMPIGLPQGVYPIKTALMVNKNEMEQSKNDIQLVLNVFDDNSMQIAALK
ncbi:hypothetical protein [Kaarinaea lacus]